MIAIIAIVMKSQMCKVFEVELEARRLSSSNGDVLCNIKHIERMEMKLEKLFAVRNLRLKKREADGGKAATTTN